MNAVNRSAIILGIAITVLVGFWSLSQYSSAMCVLNSDWPDAPCHDAGESEEQRQTDWKPYYDYKGERWMEQKKTELMVALRDDNLDEWLDENYANWNVYTYYGLFDELEKYRGLYSPLKQMEYGFGQCNIACRDGFTGIEKHDNTLACVTPQTSKALLERGGWHEERPKHGCGGSFNFDSYKVANRMETILLVPGFGSSEPPTDGKTFKIKGDVDFIESIKTTSDESFDFWGFDIKLKQNTSGIFDVMIPKNLPTPASFTNKWHYDERPFVLVNGTEILYDMIDDPCYSHLQIPINGQTDIEISYTVILAGDWQLYSPVQFDENHSCYDDVFYKD